jgi:ATP-dependent RNA helicase RhlE
MLADEAMRSVIIFARTKHGADRVTRDLERDGFEAGVIHGNKSQNARQKALNGFRDGSVRILVATDIAARGIDVPGISHVVNFDLPDEAESYVHRIGRTGRNGQDGVAITMVDPSENAKLRQVERIIRMQLPVLADHLDEPDPQSKARPQGSDARSDSEDTRPQRRDGNRRPSGGQRNANGNRGPRRGGEAGADASAGNANGRNGRQAGAAEGQARPLPPALPASVRLMARSRASSGAGPASRQQALPDAKPMNKNGGECPRHFFACL